MNDEIPIETADEDLPKLTRRKRRFADEYVTGVTGAEAIRRIGYKGTPVQAGRKAYEWLRHPAVKDYIAKRRTNLEDATGIRQERVLRRLNSIVEGTVQDLEDAEGNKIPIHKLSPEVAASIQEVEYSEYEHTDDKGVKSKRALVKKVKQHSPTQAAEQIARQLGWNKDSMELKGKLNAPAPIIQLVPYNDPDPDPVPT